jgi:hypothetical protein
MFSKNTQKLLSCTPKKGYGNKSFFRTSIVGFGLALVWKYVEKISEFLTT